jgi:hypothetical protein
MSKDYSFTKTSGTVKRFKSDKDYKENNPYSETKIENNKKGVPNARSRND